jgi:hypothetical protein
MLRFALVAVTAVLTLAGCTSEGGGSGGSDGSNASSPQPTSSSSNAPKAADCADIWKAGAILPKDYTSCVADGAPAQQDVTKCKDGSALVAYADTYFAVTGGKITKPAVAPMQDTEAFGKAYRTCAGE